MFLIITINIYFLNNLKLIYFYKNILKLLIKNLNKNNYKFNKQYLFTKNLNKISLLKSPHVNKKAWSQYYKINYQQSLQLKFLKQDFIKNNNLFDFLKNFKTSEIKILIHIN